MFELRYDSNTSSVLVTTEVGLIKDYDAFMAEILKYFNSLCRLRCNMILWYLYCAQLSLTL